MAYAYNHLGAGVPGNAVNKFYTQNIANLKQRMLTSVAEHAWRKAVAGKQLDRLERQWEERLLQEKTVRQLLRELPQQDEETVRAKLADAQPIARLVAMRVIADKRLHLEEALIERLTDSSPDVALGARQALVRLARGTDFGPAVRANQAARERSVRAWQAWLALQRQPDADSVTVARALPALTGGDADDRPTAADLATGPTERTLDAADADVVRLRDELLRTAGRDQEDLLCRLRDARGVRHTEALVQAIPALSPAMQPKARAALVERLTRMTATTLRDKFAQDHIELRRAAALAAARKGGMELVPDLVQLLDDAEPVVARAAHAALKELSGQDLAPEPDVWSAWWEKRQGP